MPRNGNGNGGRPRGVLAQIQKLRRELSEFGDRLRDLEEVVTEHDQRLDEIEEQGPAR